MPKPKLSIFVYFLRISRPNHGYIFLIQVKSKLKYGFIEQVIQSCGANLQGYE